MSKPVINIDEVELQQRPAAFAAKGPQHFRYVGRENLNVDYWEGE